MSASTYNQHIKFLRSLLHRARGGGRLDRQPLGADHVQQEEYARRAPQSDDGRTADVLAKAEGNLRLMIIVGLFTGLRLADVVNLRGENIDHNPFPPDTGPRPGFIVIKPRKTERVNKIVEFPLHHRWRSSCGI